MKTKLILIGMTGIGLEALAAAEMKRYPGGGAESDGAAAVRVERGALIHTKQFLCGDRERARSPEALRREIRDMFDQVIGVVREHGGRASTIAKLNVCVSDAASAGAVRDAIAEIWAREARPAVTLVPSALPGGSGVGCDAVAVAPGEGAGGAVVVGGSAAVAPAGRDLLYVSGRAASGELAEATRGTMKELFDVLALCGSGPRDVVQIKAFLQPMEKFEVVQREIESAFPEGAAPPVVHVAWVSTSRATEIELIAAAPRGGERDGEAVTYATPPGEKASPVFSRVARVAAGEVIYIGGIAVDAGSPEAQVKGVFERLATVARETGSDLRHLVKATYYVSSNEAGEALNAIRPQLYDPQRPPAASKVAIPPMEDAGAEMLIDMIAVPVPPGS